MSQDLFSSFFDDRTDNSHSATRNTTASANDNAINPWASEESSAWQTSSVPQTQPAIDDDDDFGDFEDASAPVIPTTTEIKETKPERSQPWKESPKASTTKPFPKQTTASLPFKPPAKVKDEAIGSHPFAGRMDLLFDAGDDEYDAGTDELGDLATNPEAAMAYSKRIIAEQEAAAARSQRSEPQNSDTLRDGSSSKRNIPSESNKRTKAAPKDPNVLFDADNVSDSEDDFGEFGSGEETWRGNVAQVQQAKRPVPSSMPAIDLLGLDDDISAEPVNGTAVRTFDQPQLDKKTAGDDSRPKIESRQWSEPDNDAWDDFETANPADNPWADETPQPARPVSQSHFASQAASKPQTETALPPTNIPPPAVLISLFPSIIAEADDALFNAIGRLDVKQRQMLLGHPASHQFLKGYLGHAGVMARIIAGRKLRWKRDQHLTQSMRIGPAAAGGKGGMKLAGLDKTESTKEDREVVDALHLWRNQVGKLRTAVTAASAAPTGPKLAPVPDISEQMPVKALKPAEGGITAPHACALCGLKREERVAKVDVEVDDSFGEWWVQGMNMHLSCRDFWNEFEKKLKSR